MQQQFNITGMSCSACSARIEKVLGKTEGINSVNVNLLRNRMSVDYDENKINTDEICAKVAKIGFGATIFSSHDIVAKETGVSVELRSLSVRLILSLIFGIPLFILAMAPMWGWQILAGIENTIAQLVLCLPVLAANRIYFIRGFKNLFALAPNMDSLIALSATASFVYQYYDSAAMITTLITLGKFLEARAKSKTTNAITTLLNLTPPTALVERHGETGEIPVSELVVGDTVIVQAGYRVPTDGKIISGEPSIDESAITGESVAVQHHPEDLVTGGTLCLQGEFRFIVTAVGENTTLASIIRLVDEATTTKAPVAQLADKISGIFVPIVILIAVISGSIWLINGATTNFALHIAVSVLVISCPCALGLATPTAIMVGTGRGATMGILIKSATALQQATEIDTIVLDKTGTITEGNPNIKDTIKKTSITAIQNLYNQNKNIIMLSGDKEEIAAQIAQEAGIKEYRSQCLPQDKEKIIRELQNTSHKVMMVGDGVNDAPALARAEVGVAIGAGTDVAIESADVVLMKSDLQDVTALLKLSHATMRCIRQNLWWAFFYNIICIPIAAGCLYPAFGILLNPMIGAAAMSCSSFCVVTNALRLKGVKL
ncbi:MAG: HAD-IC family P-type ATPase [Acidaminococcaceae bacterium]|nr:HAD-IC family P-type ATPase [Acidaminococcaceae bacterium]